MSSLQDELLKAGLIDDKQAKKAKKEKRKQQQVERRSDSSASDLARQQAEEARAKKAERDRELNRVRNLEAQQKSIVAQIKQLIQNHRQPKHTGGQEIEYNFTDDNRVKKLRVSPQVHQMIVVGQLAVVKALGAYELVPRVVAEKITQRDASFVVVANQPKGEQADEDDPYKDYQIPDDLMW